MGHDYNPKVLTPYFFNHDLEYLIYDDTDLEKRYATSLSKFPVVIYAQEGMEEEIKKCSVLQLQSITMKQL